MAQLPHQLGTADARRRLSRLEPLERALGVRRGGRSAAIRRRSERLDGEMTITFERRCRRAAANCACVAAGGREDGDNNRRRSKRERFRIVLPHVTGLDEGGLYAVDVGFIKHALDQTLDSVFGGAVRGHAGDAEGAGGGGEDEVAAWYVVCAKVGEGELDDVEGSEEVGGELVEEVVFGLVFCRCDDALEGSV